MEFTREQAEASNLVIGTLPIHGRVARVLVDPSASLCFASKEFYESLACHTPERQCDVMVDLPYGDYMRSFGYLEDVTVEVEGHQLPARLYALQLRIFDVILGMDWLEAHSAVVDCQWKTVRFEIPGAPVLCFRARKELSTGRSRQSPGLLALCVPVDSNKGPIDRSTQSRNLEFWKARACRQLWAGCRQVDSKVEVVIVAVQVETEIVAATMKSGTLVASPVTDPVAPPPLTLLAARSRGRQEQEQKCGNEGCGKCCLVGLRMSEYDTMGHSCQQPGRSCRQVEADRAQVCWLCVYLSTATRDLSTDPHSPETWSSGRHAPVDSFGLAVDST
ncbi:hypothetical protein Taro_036790 [Colocasia esculenta]|uniref:Uncharacterized protein n=1 Tax=Colocasia esculenta TaxID=4460 RepID=A0A843W3Z4_COLES|nr:hypothetical protein [Colocasia esculenta]